MKLILSLIILLGITISGIYAQEAIPTSGGDASSNKGSVSYSVGQIVYSSNTATNGTVTQGVQQAYEIYVTTGIEETGINLSVLAYPNPVINYLKLELESKKLESLSYQLYNIQGKLLQSEKIEGTESQIDMSNYISSTYFIRIINQNQSIKEFKIIKQ